MPSKQIIFKGSGLNTIDLNIYSGIYTITAIDTYVNDLDLISDPVEIDEILSRIKLYEQERKDEAGVLMIQRRQAKALYRVRTRKEAEKWLSRKVYDNGKGNRTCEWGLEFYSKSDLIDLREQLKKAA